MHSPIIQVQHFHSLSSHPDLHTFSDSYTSTLPHTSQLDMQSTYPRDSAMPSMLPPGVDPTAVDFRTFYPYIPNEVKHRKRTSRAQLKVLEDVFRKDTKPNATLRKKLAKQLDMTPRGVQVGLRSQRSSAVLTFSSHFSLST